MTRARTLLRIFVVLAGLTALSSLAAPADAVDDIETGVWWNAQLAGSPAPLPPTVPDGGLWVQQSASGPSVVSAIRFPLRSGESPAILELKINQSEAPAGQQLLACTTNTEWKVARPGPLADAPRPDCATFGAVGQLSTDGKTMTFDIAGLTATGSKASLVLVPGKPPAPVVGALPTEAFAPSPARTTFDVTFLKPNPASITLTGTPDSASEPVADNAFAASDTASTPPADSSAPDTSTATFEPARQAFRPFTAPESTGSTFSPPVSAAPPAAVARAPLAASSVFATPVSKTAKAVRESARIAAGLAFLSLFAFGNLRPGEVDGTDATETAGAGGPVGRGADGGGGNGRISIYEWPPVRLNMPEKRLGQLEGPRKQVAQLAADTTSGEGRSATPARTRPPALR